MKHNIKKNYRTKDSKMFRFIRLYLLKDIKTKSKMKTPLNIYNVASNLIC